MLEWLTYAEAAERLGISTEAVRQRSIRHVWSKRLCDDGRKEIQIDVEKLKAAARSRYQPGANNEQPPNDRSTLGQRVVDRAFKARTVEVHNAHLKKLKAMLAKAGQDLGRARRQKDVLRDEIVRLQAKLASQEREHAVEIVALLQCFVDSSSTVRNTAMAEREDDDVAPIITQRPRIEVSDLEQVRREQVRAVHHRWRAMPWVFRILFSEPPYIDMFGRIAVHTPNGAVLTT